MTLLETVGWYVTLSFIALLWGFVFLGALYDWLRKREARRVRRAQLGTWLKMRRQYERHQR